MSESPYRPSLTGSVTTRGPMKLAPRPPKPPEPENWTYRRSWFGAMIWVPWSQRDRRLTWRERFSWRSQGRNA
jgi:hypothetical protein